MDELDRTIQPVPIENLLFDPENPRLPSSVEGGDEEQIIEWMLRDATLIELMGSIGMQGYFPGEPVLVVKHATGEKFVVVEGNRRLAAAKLLMNPDLAPVRKNKVASVSQESEQKPSELPVLVYDSRDEIIDYLGYRHITGIKEWDPLAKAKYLEELYARSDATTGEEKFRELAKTIGSRANYVGRLLAGLAIYRTIAKADFFGIDDLTEETIDFSLITTALSYDNIVRFLGLATAADPALKGLNSKRIEELTHWVFERDDSGKPRVAESRNLRELSAVVETEDALERFRAGLSLKDAAMLTKLPTEVFRSSISEARSKISLARDQSHRIDEPRVADLTTLDEVATIATDLKTVIEKRIADTEED